MKLLEVTRVKVICSKGRIEKGDRVVLDDAEYAKIIYMIPDAFRVLDADYKEAEEEAPKPKRARKAKE